MIHFRWYRSGALFGVRYDFEKGDALPEHAHDPANEHNVIVLQGFVCVALPNSRKLYASQGDVIDFDGCERHTVCCLSATAAILNLWLNGIPAGYAQLPASEHEGVL